MSLIPPHGGTLVDRVLTGSEREGARQRAASLPALRLSPRQLDDLEMIATGALSPLTGFMGAADYRRCCREGRLASGLPWPLPISLALKHKLHEPLQAGQEVALCDPRGRPLAIMELEEVFDSSPEREAPLVYGTADPQHPGVEALLQERGPRLGGGIWLFDPPSEREFPELRLTPAQTREEFERRGWSRVVGFQTRNPIHRAHEYLLKCALELVDGLLIHPLVGVTKAGDLPAALRLACYRALVEGYFPPDRVVLSLFPAYMRYAGPREALFHALVRQNYGCSHFIVGRDHAGVGSYYGTYDAHDIFDTLAPGELGVTPLRFDHAFFCTACGNMASSKSCPHESESHVFLSGTRVREMLARGERPPAEFTRPEVAQILMGAYRKAAP